MKMFNLQFSTPFYLTKMMQNLGDYYPMELAWTFLGLSDGYNLFIGLAEICGVFLFFRRTLTLGVLILLVVVSNVVAINFFYYVPVKVLSSHLLLMLLFLITPNLKDLWCFFVKNKAVKLRQVYKPKLNKNIIKSLILIKLLLIINELGYGTYETIKRKEEWVGSKNYSNLRGLYEVESFIISKKDSSKLVNIPNWKYLMIDTKTRATIKTTDFKDTRYDIEVDSIKKTIILKQQFDTLKYFNLKYQKIDGLLFLFKGKTYLNDSVYIKTSRIKYYKEKFELTNKGFDWVNKGPSNRY